MRVDFEEMIEERCLVDCGTAQEMDNLLEVYAMNSLVVNISRFYQAIHAPKQCYMVSISKTIFKIKP